MDSFKLWLELFYPAKTSLKYKKITKYPGTMKARQGIEYSFSTKLGNLVKVHFYKMDDGSYDVSFYVNDTQHDNASAIDDNNVRDPEILPKVLWTIKDKVNRLKINKLQFIAQDGLGDLKIVRGINPEQYKKPLFEEINKLEASMHVYKAELVHYNAELWKKLNRPVPPPRLNFDKSKWLRILNNLKQEINSGQVIDYDNLISSMYIDELFSKFSLNDFVNLLKKYSNAVMSNTPSGYPQRINRRESIYQKLVDRFFSDWNVEKYDAKFILTRK